MDMFYIPFINVLVTYYQNTSEHLLVGSILEVWVGKLCTS